MQSKHHNALKWTTRIIALMALLFGLPFYFGYGNPLPFLSPEYTAWDNMWLTVFPIMFIGLALGWKYEKVGGFLVTIPVALGLILGLILERELVYYMLLPLAVGILFLIVGYKKIRGSKQ